MKMKYKFLNKQEEEKAIIHILETLLDNSVPYSGEHRKEQWEKGWAENLESGDSTPKYFGKYKVNRLNGRFVYGVSKIVAQDTISGKSLKLILVQRIMDLIGRNLLMQ